jgi:hypothetical protein
MSGDEFWRLIDASRAAMTDQRDGNMDRQEKRLRELLRQLDPEEIVSFREQFHGWVRRAYDWDLWAVAEIVGQGCGDDWFDYFRFWLVSCGRELYERALARPDQIDRIFAESRSDDYFFESISYVPGEVYRSLTGRPIPDLASDEPLVVRGRQWESEEELAARFPALWAKYSGG